MKCTNAEFLANASALMRKAEEAEEPLEICGEDGEVRMVCSVPGFRSNVIRKARPVDAVVSFFRFRPDKPLPKGWDLESLAGVTPGHYIVWWNRTSERVGAPIYIDAEGWHRMPGMFWNAVSEKDFEKKYAILEDWE